MNAQLRALGCKDSFRMRGGARGGLWAAFTASKTVPLDQGSVSGIMQHVSDESVRRQVRQLPFCCHHNVVDVVSGMEAALVFKGICSFLHTLCTSFSTIE